jgi:hypothetical protein
MGELHSLRRQFVEVRRSKIRPAVTAQVAPAHIIGEDEDDVGPRRSLRDNPRGSRRTDRTGDELAPSQMVSLIFHAV